MNLTVKIKRFLKRKLATAVLVSASVAAFATLGDGGGGKKGQSSFTGMGKSSTSKNLSLHSNFNYRGNHLFSTNQPKYITLSTTVTYQKGNATYIVPLKKKVLLDKIKFNPAQNKY